MPIFAAMPGLNDIPSFLADCDEIKANEAEYHVGGEYLSMSGEKRSKGRPSVAWKMATFVKSFYPKTKLTEAAAFSNENITNYEDVFPYWETLCRGMASAALEKDIDLEVFQSIPLLWHRWSHH